MPTIKPADFEKTVEKVLEEWAQVTEEAAAQGVIETAEKAVAELHQAHPAGSGEYGSWNDYNAGWTREKLKIKGEAYSETIYNKTKYRLAHLLENGHAKLNGGRTRAFPHIAPVAEKAEDDLFKNIKKHIQ